MSEFSCRIFEFGDDIVVMMAPTDLELLGQYARGGAEEAFAALVHRHLDLVYSAALRQVRSPQLAEEVAQSVFTDLSAAAHRLKTETGLTGWLYQVTRRTAVDVVRRESRRQLRERLAVELTDMNAHPSIWSQIEPLLDEAMESLEGDERNAILLRFFENRSLREVGQTLGTSEDAAQKRVSRAVDRLREFFAKRGVTVGATSLVAALSANAVQSAPLGLAMAISSGAVSATAGAALQSSTIMSATKAITMTTIQKILITTALTVGLGAGIYENRRAAQWREQVQALQLAQNPLSDQLRQLQQEREAATTRLASLQQENQELQRSLAELPKLRGELARVRESTRDLQLQAASGEAGNDPAIESAFKVWAARATLLRQRLEQTSDQRIPELQFLTEKSWFDAVKDMKQLQTDDDFRRAFSEVRNIAKAEFGRLLQQALRAYTDANEGQLPGDLAQLKPFFEAPVDDAVLQRYKMLQTGKVSDIPKDEYLVADVAPLLDEDHDAVYQFSLNGTHSHSGDPNESIVRDAGIQYAEAHNGLLPTDPAQLTPYLQQAVAPEKIQKILNKVPPGVTTLQQLRAVLR
jgi:RNA polymerase sigma factor (sigma-70 family)